MDQSFLLMLESSFRSFDTKKTSISVVRIESCKNIMASFNVREATVHDCDDLMRMAKELAAFLKEETMIDAQDLRKDGFGEKQFFHAFVAELTTEGSDGKRPLVGYLAYVYTFDLRFGRTCTVENFYVDEQWRNKGIGSVLSATVCKAALSMGCVKLYGIVDNWNKQAVDFYQRRGVCDRTEKDGWLVYCMERNAMKNLVVKTLPIAVNRL